MLAAPGNDTQLSEQIARIIARPLDRSRPLWELYMIAGLASGHTAMLTKIHDAIVDGISGAEITGLLLDLTAAGPKPFTPDPSGHDSPPEHVGMLARALREVPRFPRRALRSQPAAVPKRDETRFGAIPTTTGTALASVAKRIERAIFGVHDEPVHAGVWLLR